ncbi:MAG TPA: NUDIX domain-containing protein [Solirubrobacteraceae bacterium]
MANRTSAGLLVYRRAPSGAIEVLIAHMGGPFWARKDNGAWSIPKGEYDPSEDPLQAALREFEEELGHPPPQGLPLHLGSVRQPSGKIIDVWALQGDLDVRDIHSNTFELQWPPGSGELRDYPEVDRAGWFDLAQARDKLTRGQVPFLEELERRLN